MTTATIDRLTALDRLMLGASVRWPQDVGALVILDGAALVDPTGALRIEAVRTELGARLHLVPRFRQVIHTPGRGLGGPVWVDAPRFDLVDHVRELPLEPPAGEPELLAAVERLRRRRLDPSRPAWEIWLLPGLADGRVGCFVRIHHTIADGMAALLSVTALLEPGAETGSPAPWVPRPWPSSRRLFLDNLGRRVRTVVGLGSAIAHPRSTARRVTDAWPAIRELLAERPSTKTSLDRMVGPGPGGRARPRSVCGCPGGRPGPRGDRQRRPPRGPRRRTPGAAPSPRRAGPRHHAPGLRAGLAPTPAARPAAGQPHRPDGGPSPPGRIGPRSPAPGDLERDRPPEGQGPDLARCPPGRRSVDAPADARRGDASAGQRHDREPARPPDAAVPRRGPDSRGLPAPAAHRRRAARRRRAVLRRGVGHRHHRGPGRVPGPRRLRRRDGARAPGPHWVGRPARCELGRPAPKLRTLPWSLS